AVHQRIAQRRANEAHDLARLVADRLERQVLDAAAVGRADRRVLLQRVERAQRLFVCGEEGDEIAAVHEAPAERRGDALLGPGLELARERVIEGEHQAAIGRAQERAAALRAFGKGQNIELRRRAAQVRHVEALERERRGKARGEAVRRERQAFFEDIDDAPARALRRLARARNVVDRDGFRYGTHCRFPASSKIGMYIKTTITPMTRPMIAIRIGSNRRVNQSTQRASSSSWKAATCSSISPMLPPFSPTPIMRSATGVVRPFASSDCETLRPSEMARLAAARRWRRSGCRSSAPMSSEATSGMPPRRSMPIVR